MLRVMGSWLNLLTGKIAKKKTRLNKQTVRKKKICPVDYALGLHPQSNQVLRWFIFLFGPNGKKRNEGIVHHLFPQSRIYAIKAKTFGRLESLQISHHIRHVWWMKIGPRYLLRRQKTKNLWAKIECSTLYQKSFTTTRCATRTA